MSPLSVFLVILAVSDVAVLAARSLNKASSSEIAESAIEKVEKDYIAWLDRMAARTPAPVIGPEMFESKAAAQVITVDQTPGQGNFQKIQDAVNSVPKKNDQRVIIQIAAGVYEEKVKIPRQKPFITFQGAGMDVTKITWNDTAQISGSTFKSATVSVMAPGFIGRDISFENTAPTPTQGEVGGQAVAFQISGDQSALYSCGFYGAQDTLYDHKGRHYFNNCTIRGSVDFIFGDGQSLYEDCILETTSTATGSLTAQKRKLESENTGFSFVNSTISGSGIVYLGRAWGAFSRVVYIYSYMDNIIVPAGWNDWGESSRQETVFYGEYECSGPGANVNNRVAWSHELTDVQAAPFMSLSFIDGQLWLPVA